MIGQKVWLRENHEPHERKREFHARVRDVRVKSSQSFRTNPGNQGMTYPYSCGSVPGTFFLDKNLSNGVSHLSTRDATWLNFFRYTMSFSLIKLLVFAFFLLTAPGLSLGAQGFPPPSDTPGEPAMAERWADWAERAIADGRWKEAEAGLERARDFASVSSDLSYLLALVLRHENRPQTAVLETARRAIETDRWKNHNAAEARLVEAGVLIRLRSYEEALACLSRSGGNTPVLDASCLRLLALLGAGSIREFRAEMALALDRFPDAGGPVRILFQYAAGRIPHDDDRPLIDTALARLDRYLDAAPDLAFRAIPFIRDTVKARRLILAYRSGGGDDPAALPAALDLGVIDEARAASELFRPRDAAPASALDRDLVQKIGGLLRHDEGRELFARNLLRFSGVISEDTDQDGVGEAFTRYENGEPKEYRRDADQDGVFEWLIRMNAGEPSSAVLPVNAGFGGPGELELFWERYPWIQRAVFDKVTYIYRPRNFPLSPVRFGPLAGDGAFPYPFWDSGDSRPTVRTLVSFAGTIERPGREFPGAVERIELERGIPISGAEYLRGRTVSITEYRNGQAVLRRLDLDLDGRMETLRRFRTPPSRLPGEEPAYDPLEYEAVPETSESDWDGDGIYETGEEYLIDGRTARSWDMNRDGIREYTEINYGEEKTTNYTNRK
jgi:tetratricopeptide (TPR) repeat protein